MLLYRFFVRYVRLHSIQFLCCLMPFHHEVYTHPTPVLRMSSSNRHNSKRTLCAVHFVGNQIHFILYFALSNESCLVWVFFLRMCMYLITITVLANNNKGCSFCYSFFTLVFAFFLYCFGCMNFKHFD